MVGPLHEKDFAVDLTTSNKLSCEFSQYYILPQLIANKSFNEVLRDLTRTATSDRYARILSNFFQFYH